MRRKILSIILATTIISSAFVGCGNADTTSENTSEAVQQEEIKQEDVDVEAEDTEIEATEGQVTQTEAAEFETDIDELTFTYVTAPLNIPTIVDRNERIFVEKFDELGIDINYVEITSGADQTQALASGDVQVLYAVGATSVILSAANGADIKVLNMYSRSPEAFCLYASDDSLTSPESLVGKTIAGPAGTNLHELLVAYLATADLTIDDVNFVNMSIADAKAGLDGGSVDVALLAGAAAYNADKAGYNLVTNGKGLISALIMVAVTEEFYNNNPEIIDVIKSAEDEIISYINDNPDETVAYAAGALDLEEEAVNEMKQYYDFSLETSEADIEGFQKTADFMYESEMIETEVDVTTLFLE